MTLNNALEEEISLKYEIEKFRESTKPKKTQLNEIRQIINSKNVFSIIMNLIMV